MNPSVALALAVEVAAESLSGGPVARQVWCLCTYCAEELDPAWAHPAYLAPPSSECMRCSSTARWLAGGFVFLVLPKSNDTKETSR